MAIAQDLQKQSFNNLTVGQAQERVNAIKEQQPKNFNVDTSLNAQEIGNVKPLNVNIPVQSTGAEGITGSIEALNKSFQTQIADNQKLELDKQNAQEQVNKDKGGKTTIMDKILGVSASRGQVEEDFKVADKAQALTDVTNQIEASQRAQTNELRALEQVGLTPVQKNQKARDINRRYAFEQADLAVIQSAANRDFTTAQSMADRKINIQLEPLKMELDFVNEFYQENREDLSKADQRAFESRSNLIQQEYNRQYSEYKEVSDTKLSLLRSASEQGAPQEVLSAIQNSQTSAQAIQNAGQYGGDILARKIKQQQLNNLQIDARKAMKSLSEEAPANGLLAQSQSLGNIQLIGALAASPAIDSAVGTTPASRGAGGLKGFFGRLMGGALAGAGAGAAGGALVGGIGAIPGAIGGAIIGGVSASGQGAKDTFTGQRQNFIAGVEQLSSQLSLDTLIQAKAKGATFGALSDTELKILSASASKLGTWAIKDNNGKVFGYSTSEKNLKEELDKINNYAKLDYLIKGGNPEDIGAVVQTDGTIWVQNSDGTYTQLY